MPCRPIRTAIICQIRMTQVYLYLRQSTPGGSYVASTQAGPTAKLKRTAIHHGKTKYTDVLHCGDTTWSPVISIPGICVTTTYSVSMNEPLTCTMSILTLQFSLFRKRRWLKVVSVDNKLSSNGDDDSLKLESSTLSRSNLLSCVFTYLAFHSCPISILKWYNIAVRL